MQGRSLNLTPIIGSHIRFMRRVVISKVVGPINLKLGVHVFKHNNKNNKKMNKSPIQIQVM
jgi:hypothetical protein